MRLIDADRLSQEVFSHEYSVMVLETENKVLGEVLTMIHNAPTVLTNEMKPLFDKVIDMMPELVSAITDALPNIVNSRIKCSECGYYQKPTGKWVWIRTEIHHPFDWGNIYCTNCHKDLIKGVPKLRMKGKLYDFCPNCGVKMEVTSDGNKLGHGDSEGL